MDREGSEFVRHEPCPECGSRNNLGRYTDGHGHCYGCGYYEKGDAHMGDTPQVTNKPTELLTGEYRSLGKRRLTEETCRKWGYLVGEHKGEQVHIAQYRNERQQVVAQKLRYADKDKGLPWIGKPKDALPLYGQWMWRDKGKMLVITEGELDALSVSQVQGNKWPVVSVRNGAQGAAKNVADAMEWVLGFDEVVIMFDMDEPGQEAAEKVASILPPGRAKIAHLPLKDASDMLMAGRSSELVDAIWGAKSFRPDGVVAVSDVIDRALEPVTMGHPWFMPTLTKLTYGRRPCELYTFGAGTGVGKTDLFTQQIAYDITTLGMTVGVIYLEQPVHETAKRIAGKIAGRLFHVPGAEWTDEELLEALMKIDGKLYLYDHFGETDWDIVKSRIRYMATALGIKMIYLDHLTAMANPNNERESLEKIMKEMAGLAQELGITIHLISHLATPEGKPHEEGGRVMIRHFKGARAIGFWSYFMFGLERNQQDDDEAARKVTTFRVLKDRYTGQATGKTIPLHYAEDTGLLREMEEGELCLDQPTTEEDY